MEDEEKEEDEEKGEEEEGDEDEQSTFLFMPIKVAAWLLLLAWVVADGVACMHIWHGEVAW